MNASHISAVVALLAVGCSSLTAQQSAKTAVEFRVVDIQGAGIPGAVIHIEPQPDPTRVSFETDEHGTRLVEADPGVYAFMVSASGFAAYSSRFTVRNDGKRQLIPVKLQIASFPNPVIVNPCPPATEITIGGPRYPDVRAVLSLTDLRELPHVSVTVHDLNSRQDEKYSAIPLLDILVRAGVISLKDLNYPSPSSFLVLKGACGESAVIALSELAQSTSPSAILVADSIDGHPLSSNDGPLQLLLTNDKTRSRAIRGLNSILLEYAH